MNADQRDLTSSNPDIEPYIGRKLADVERDLIIGTLARCGGNRTWAADILGISVRTLRNKLQLYADFQKKGKTSSRSKSATSGGIKPTHVPQTNLLS